MPRSIHIVGAGLAGLSAAVRLVGSGARVVLYEATSQAGGRCRSYFDPSLDMTIDNGNHLILSGNRATLAYLDTIGTRAQLVGPAHADYPFVDLKTGERWTLRANDGFVPWWILDPVRRVPGTRALDYLSLLRLLFGRRDATIGDVLDCAGPLYERLLGPLLLAVLNTDPMNGSARLAAAVLRQTLVTGGQNYRPLIAARGLSAIFIDPALRAIEFGGGVIAFSRRLRGIEHRENLVKTLDFGDATVPVDASDRVVLAVPPTTVATLFPELTTPNEFHAIVNAHFRIDPPVGLAPMTGVVNGIVEWVFAYDRRLSVTISNADRLLDTPREELAARIWRDVARIADMDAAMPPWQIVRERRATFAAVPSQDARRPAAQTSLGNLVLAGDWTETGLPATIEGAIRSGDRAAQIALSGN